MYILRRCQADEAMPVFGLNPPPPPPPPLPFPPPFPPPPLGPPVGAVGSEKPEVKGNVPVTEVAGGEEIVLAELELLAMAVLLKDLRVMNESG
ncbi:hypothetical protein H0H81_010041 [Sphagnurus paluster]|uniref:Uncharacterized protein n=1 Tax=Sphagnurus paluster TaxID=117069 RepID=A0A9P7KIM7_9AGAR|nr:hypothetical protein H0H81_010041 [Sphagnurus paluster]